MREREREREGKRERVTLCRNSIGGKCDRTRWLDGHWVGNETSFVFSVSVSEDVAPIAVHFLAEQGGVHYCVGLG